MVKKILIYVGGEMRRRTTSLSDLSWEHVGRRLRFVMFCTCPQMTMKAPGVLILRL